MLLLAFNSFLAVNLTFCRYGSASLPFWHTVSIQSVSTEARGPRSPGMASSHAGQEWPKRLKKGKNQRILRHKKSPLFSISYQTHSNPAVLCKPWCSVRLDVVHVVKCACWMLVPAARRKLWGPDWRMRSFNWSQEGPLWEAQGIQNKTANVSTFIIVHQLSMSPPCWWHHELVFSLFVFVIACYAFFTVFCSVFVSLMRIHSVSKLTYV